MAKEEQFIEVPFGDGKPAMMRVRRYPARAERWAPTNAYAPCYALRAITHVPTGMRLGKDFRPRMAQIVCVVLDRILPGPTLEEILAQFTALPLPLRKWILLLKKGGRI